MRKSEFDSNEQIPIEILSEDSVSDTTDTERRMALLHSFLNQSDADWKVLSARDRLSAMCDMMNETDLRAFILDLFDRHPDMFFG